ncbi:hypothetical protein J2R73_006065 [Bradyrhizobium japonicum]|nr:hypothetical protein [Bradyrhizobium japonicum]MCW2324943.1 hypothetical protein [Bradyrhizobium japonicum]
MPIQRVSYPHCALRPVCTRSPFLLVSWHPLSLRLPQYALFQPDGLAPIEPPHHFGRIET